MLRQAKIDWENKETEKADLENEKPKHREEEEEEKEARIEENKYSPDTIPNNLKRRLVIFILCLTLSRTMV